MKYSKILISAAVLISIVVSGFNCGKDSSPTPSGEDTYLGTWKWEKSVGGFAGGTITPQTEGYSQTLILAGSRVYQAYRDDLLLRSGSYDVSWGWREWLHDSCYVISYENNPEEQIIRWHADTLELVDMCYDCYWHLYTRAE